jgi:membrane protein YdbS with pleckstrin-like domain
MTTSWLAAFGTWLSQKSNFLTMATAAIGVPFLVISFIWLRLTYGIGGPVFWFVSAVAIFVMAYVWSVLMWHAMGKSHASRIASSQGHMNVEDESTTK